MQVLFTCVPAHGHLNPMVPVAREFVARGWEVCVATGSQLVPRVEELGFRSLAAGPTLTDMQAHALADPEARAALETSPSMAAAAIFGGRARPFAADLRGIDLSPDLVVHDAMEMGGPVIAARRGVPWVTHGLGPRWPSLVEDEMPRFVDRAWRDNGLEPVARGGLGHHAYIEICPPAVRSENPRAGGRVIEARSVPMAEPENLVAPFVDDERPSVYCTLGTFSNSNADVFRTILDAVGSLNVEVLLTTGWGIRRDELGPVPANVTVEEYVPQAQVIRRSDLVVSHGGSGTMLASLGAGVPIVAIPQGADQFINAPYWVGSGAVTVMQPAELDSASLASTISSTLEDSAMRLAAEATALDIAAMPPPAETADVLIELAGFHPTA